MAPCKSEFDTPDIGERLLDIGLGNDFLAKGTGNKRKVVKWDHIKLRNKIKYLQTISDKELTSKTYQKLIQLSKSKWLTDGQRT